jgi:penicillin-binding protein 1B
MAAIVNGPGIYNPFTQLEKAKTRRAKVLLRMRELNMIGEDDEKNAAKEDLPQKPPEVLTETAPYFVDAVLNQLQTLKIDSEKGLRVYTTLNRRAQQVATASVSKTLARLEKDFKKIKEQKEKNKNLLETCLISADPNSGFIQALVGGRGYKTSQFNRAISGHRQVGSIMKPLVYLAALENVTPEGNPYTPLTIVEDVKFTYKYEGQKWSPDNYDKKYRGQIPLYQGLKDSLNAATASVGVAIGLSSVVDVARRLGIESKLLPLPSITLGAFELYPIEVLRAYTTMARTGSKIDLSFIRTVEDLDANLVYAHHYKEETATAPENVGVLVGMMKQAFETGTARAARLWGFKHPAAGKTGTTSDYRDSWFAGFTPYHVAIAWIGYDNNEPHGLTGTSGALPIWTDYMKNYASHFPPIDFPLPENTVKVKVPAIPQEVTDEAKRDPTWPTEIELVFKVGTEPQ